MKDVYTLPSPIATELINPAATCLEAWLRLTDEADIVHYLAQHHAVLATTATQAVLRRWIAATPPELAAAWAKRLPLLGAASLAA